VWPIFLSVIHFHKCDPFFQVWPIFSSVTHFSKCEPFSKCDPFFRCDPFFEVWPTFRAPIAREALKNMRYRFNTCRIISLRRRSTRNWNLLKNKKVVCEISPFPPELYCSLISNIDGRATRGAVWYATFFRWASKLLKCPNPARKGWISACKLVVVTCADFQLTR